MSACFRFYLSVPMEFWLSLVPWAPEMPLAFFIGVALPLGLDFCHKVIPEVGLELMYFLQIITLARR